MRGKFNKLEKLTVKTRISETGKGPSINWTRVICWQTPTVFWMCRGPFFSVAECTWELTLCSLKYIQLSYLCLSPVPLWFRWLLKSLEDVNHHNQIPAELSQDEGKKLHSEIHILIWNNEELPQQWNKLITEPVYKKGDMTVLLSRHISINNYIKIWLNIFLSRWTPIVDKITGDHHRGFWHSRSTIDHIFCSH